MRRGPQNSRRVHQVAVALNVDGQAAVLAVGQRRAHGRWRAVADAVAARAADVLVVLVEIPQPLRPVADERSWRRPATNLRSEFAPTAPRTGARC